VRARGQIALAGLGGDGETGRHGQPEIRHFREIGALAPEQIFEVFVALGEVVDELLSADVALHRNAPPVSIAPA
jgi:hypothetical protein